uniref:Uncharacterized protein n=1 Tax=Timema genevievae TaxID=629358 RepID=A0A7R9K6I7_TIMGE|nr:unnamed protein product [Timema genevievae]
MMPYMYLTNEVMCSQGEETKEGERARPTMAVANNSTAPQEQEISEHTKERVLAIEKLMTEQTASRKEERSVARSQCRGRIVAWSEVMGGVLLGLKVVGILLLGLNVVEGLVLGLKVAGGLLLDRGRIVAWSEVVGELLLGLKVVGGLLLGLKVVIVNTALDTSDNPGLECCIVGGNLMKLFADVDTLLLLGRVWEGGVVAKGGNSPRPHIQGGHISPKND